ncbi:MAG TPA: DUF1501 domain-containing protein [Kofleriaceae bacterium]|nr:DUF1501 domain-containing protein [Kofleriaceae bacterium]
MKLGAGWLAASLLGCGTKTSPGGKQEPVPPRADRTARYFVLILLSGGHDTIYTTDPKTDKDVDSMVTLPSENHISPGAVQLGPHFTPLVRWTEQLAVLNGVQVRTANHDTGQKQFFHLKTNIIDGMPNALDAIATHRSGQPLGVAYINLSSRVMHSPAYFGTADKFYYGDGDVFDQVSKATPQELAQLARTYRKQAGEIGRSGAGWREAEQTAVYLREVADFFEQVAHVPALSSRERSSDYVAQSMAESLDRTLWLLEHDLCCGVVVDLGLLGWDTHIRNEPKQQEMNGNFATFFDDFLGELHSRKNKHGLLSDHTVTVVGSELGRFPHQNDMLGKDHLPQTSFLFTGPGIRGGRTFGRTGRRMEGLPISFQNGDAIDSGRVPLLDDVGTTLLRLAGLDPERYGYSGKVCEFLLDQTS